MPKEGTVQEGPWNNGIGLGRGTSESGSTLTEKQREGLGTHVRWGVSPGWSAGHLKPPKVKMLSQPRLVRVSVKKVLATVIKILDRVIPELTPLGHELSKTRSCKYNSQQVQRGASGCHQEGAQSPPELVVLLPCFPAATPLH